MKLFKKISAALILAALMLFPLGIVQAQEVIDPELCRRNPDSTLCKSNSVPQDPGNNSLYGPNGVLTRVARLLSVVVGVAAVIMIIIGGLRYILASGDPTNIQGAKNTILYAIIGLLVALLAQGIISFVLVRV